MVTTGRNWPPRPMVRRARLRRGSQGRLRFDECDDSTSSLPGEFFRERRHAVSRGLVSTIRARELARASAARTTRAGSLQHGHEGRAGGPGSGAQNDPGPGRCRTQDPYPRLTPFHTSQDWDKRQMPRVLRFFEAMATSCMSLASHVIRRCQWITMQPTKSGCAPRCISSPAH